MCCGQKVVENGGTDGLESGGNSVGNYNSGGTSGTVHCRGGFLSVMEPQIPRHDETVS